MTTMAAIPLRTVERTAISAGGRLLPRNMGMAGVEIDTTA